MEVILESVEKNLSPMPVLGAPSPSGVAQFLGVKHE
jgi:hypothetical protein